MKPTFAPLPANRDLALNIRPTRTQIVARNEPVTGNEFTRARQRLNSDSE